MTTPILCAPSRRGPSIAAGVRLTPRGRAAFAVAVSLLLLGVVLVALLESVVQARSMAVDPGVDAAAVVATEPGAVLAAEGRATAYTVSEGDTLWDLAVALSPGGDPRPLVDQIQQLNAMAGSSLTVGERLWLPLPGE